jgi:hypothetical protein
MTRWRPPERTRQATAIYAAAEADRTAHPEKYALDPDEIVTKAVRDADPASLGDPALWREGLEHYLKSAEDDGNLNAVGRTMVRSSAVANLRARMVMSRFPRPDALLGPPPIVIIGGWRTGTTFLQRLLATDPRLRAPCWPNSAPPGVSRPPTTPAARNS